MGSKTISASVDEAIVGQVTETARLDGMTLSQVLGGSLSLYLRLPDDARRAFRVIEALGSDIERERTVSNVTRALVSGAFEATKRNIASRITVPAGLDDDALTDLAVGLVEDARR